MIEQTAPAADQLQQMQAAISALEAELIEAAADGSRYAQLISRRSAMQREVERLQYAAELERRQQDAAHRAALHERFHDAVSTAAALRQEGAGIEAEIGALLAQLEGLLARAGRLTREHRDCAARSANAASALRQLAEQPPAGGVGDWHCPGQASAVAVWHSAHATLTAAGLNPRSAACQQPNAAHRR